MSKLSNISLVKAARDISWTILKYYLRYCYKITTTTHAITVEIMINDISRVEVCKEIFKYKKEKKIFKSIGYLIVYFVSVFSTDGRRHPRWKGKGNLCVISRHLTVQEQV